MIELLICIFFLMGLLGAFLGATTAADGRLQQSRFPTREKTQWSE